MGDSDGEVQEFLHSVAALTITTAQGQETQMPAVPDYRDPYYIEEDAESLLPVGFDVETIPISWDNDLPDDGNPKPKNQ